jgi:sugar (pentulose or hexulose) kinase
MKADLVIGLDVSTTATKAIAWTKSGQALAEGRAATAISRPKPGWFEQDVALWTESAAKALRQLSRKIDMGRVGAIGISNQRESFAQFDLHDKPLRAGTLWLDERSHVEVKELALEIGAGRLHEISGKPSDVTPCIGRCRWLQKYEPKLWAKTAMTADVHGVLSHFLTDNWHTSLASADPMGLVDMRAVDWSEDLIAAVGLSRHQLTKIFRSGDVIGTVTSAAAKRTGLQVGTPVVAGGGDGQCAGTGANVFAKGRAYLNLGTAVVSGSYGAGYAHDPAFRTLTAVSESGYIYETAIRTGTFLVNWVVENLFNVELSKNPKIFSKLEKEAMASPIGARGLALIPYWSGSMTPYWDTSARGVIAGLSANHTRGDIYRAILEGIALEQVMMTKRVCAATSPIDHYVIMGGGAQSDLWCQMIADTAGKDVKRLDTVEASSLGAAMAAAKSVGWYSSIPKAAASMSGKPSKTFRPRMKSHKAYCELLDIYQNLWPQISNWNARLQKFADTQHG